MKPVFEVRQLSVNYEKTSVLWDVTFSLPEGVLAALVGPNGAGKSTLLKAALGLTPIFGGGVSFFGLPLKRVRRRVAYVPQRASVDWDFPLTVYDLVLMGSYGRRGWFRRTTAADRAKAYEYLAAVGLEDYAHRQISQLSGGQQQRAFIARALMQEADIYLMDEPFVGIDVSSEKTVIAILQKLRAAGKTLLVVYHDLENVNKIFDWVILLNLRLVASGLLQEVFTPENIQKTYGKEVVLLDEAARLSQDKELGFVNL